VDLRAKDMAHYRSQMAIFPVNKESGLVDNCHRRQRSFLTASPQAAWIPLVVRKIIGARVCAGRLCLQEGLHMGSFQQAFGFFGD
jgi:hypothetical protein